MGRTGPGREGEGGREGGSEGEGGADRGRGLGHVTKRLQERGAARGRAGPSGPERVPAQVGAKLRAGIQWVCLSPGAVISPVAAAPTLESLHSPIGAL